MESFLCMQPSATTVVLLLAVARMLWAGGALAQEGASPKGTGQSAYYSDSTILRTELVRHPEKTDEIVRNSGRAIVENINNPAKLVQSTSLFSEVLWSLSSDSSNLSRGQANQTADALIEVLERHRGRFPDRGVVIADFIFLFGETARSRAFVLSILRGESSHRDFARRAALGLHRGRTFRRDREVFDALLKISNGTSGDLRDDNTFVALSAMIRIDIDRATPILLQKIYRVNDILSFNKASSIVSDTRKPELMKAIFIRYSDFKYSDPSINGNPAIGISKEAVINYLANVEDRDLEQGLDILFQIGGHPPQSRPVLINKLGSRSPRSRKAVLNYILRETQRGAFLEESMRRDIDAHIHLEKDADVLALAVRASKEIQDRLRKQR